MIAKGARETLVHADPRDFVGKSVIGNIGTCYNAFLGVIIRMKAQRALFHTFIGREVSKGDELIVTLQDTPTNIGIGQVPEDCRAICHIYA